MNDPKQPGKFPKRIAFNVIPQIDVFMEDGNTKEEWKMIEETKKIMGANIPVSATCVRVPVFVGHAESVNIEFENHIDADEVYEILSDAEGIDVYDKQEAGGYITPHEATGNDSVFVSRIRQDKSVKHGINLWCVADNLRKGAALNAVQIAEVLIAKYNLAGKNQNAKAAAAAN
jgi:aspartate-semialdehyde dehydrogenase